MKECMRLVGLKTSSLRGLWDVEVACIQVKQSFPDLGSKLFKLGGVKVTWKEVTWQLSFLDFVRLIRRRSNIRFLQQSFINLKVQDCVSSNA